MRMAIGPKGDGLHVAGGAWPGAVCANCRVPFQLICALFVGDPHLDGLSMSCGDVIPLMFCWRCPASTQALVYAFSGSFEVLSICAGERMQGGVLGGLADIGPVGSWTCRGSVGGWARRVSCVVVDAEPGDVVGADDMSVGPSCVRCRRLMRPLARFYDPGPPVDLCGNEDVAMDFYLCGNCCVVWAGYVMED